jgi:hypothetical protein
MISQKNLDKFFIQTNISVLKKNVLLIVEKLFSFEIW